MCVARLASIQFERSDPSELKPQHARLLYSQMRDKRAVVTAVIGLLNGVSLPPASLLTKAEAPPGVETMQWPPVSRDISAPLECLRGERIFSPLG